MLSYAVMAVHAQVWYIVRDLTRAIDYSSGRIVPIPYKESICSESLGGTVINQANTLNTCSFELVQQQLLL